MILRCAAAAAPTIAACSTHMRSARPSLFSPRWSRVTLCQQATHWRSAPSRCTLTWQRPTTCSRSPSTPRGREHNRGTLSTEQRNRLRLVRFHSLSGFVSTLTSTVWLAVAGRDSASVAAKRSPGLPLLPFTHSYSIQEETCSRNGIAHQSVGQQQVARRGRCDRRAARPPWTRQVHRLAN
jgi:hypothetical protein